MNANHAGNLIIAVKNRYDSERREGGIGAGEGWHARRHAI